MKKTERLYMRIDKNTKDKIEQLAKQENRSMSNWIESIILEKLQGEKEMKNKLNASNLINTYYDNGLYELLFDVEGKEVFVRNIKEEDHPDAWNDEWYFDNDEVIERIIRNVDERDIEIEENEMNNLEGKKVKDLSAEEREYLESIISGDYRGPENKLEIGRNEVTIDFENGLSVAGWIINTEEEWYYEMDEEGIIYNPSK